MVLGTRYVVPLREGGSLPGVVDVDGEGPYVVKFRGAGQGHKALVAELVAGEIARALGLPVPEIVFMELDGDLARAEPDPEIQELIRASVGLNLALDYLPGAVTFDPVVEKPEAELASSIVWFDALVTNIDRSARKGQKPPRLPFLKRILSYTMLAMIMNVARTPLAEGTKAPLAAFPR